MASTDSAVRQLQEISNLPADQAQQLLAARVVRGRAPQPLQAAVQVLPLRRQHEVARARVVPQFLQVDGVCGPQQVASLAGYFAEYTNSQARAGKWMST